MQHYYHEVPGRIRVKCSALKGNHEQCRSAESLLAREEGLHTVTANPVTGSIIVHYHPEQATSTRVRDLLCLHGYFHPQQTVPADPSLERSLEKIGHALGRAVLGAVVEKLLEGTSLSLLSVLL